MPVNHFGTHLRLLGMAALWGASWPLGRVIAQTMPPLAAASMRFVLASLVLLPWLLHSARRNVWRGWPRKRWIGMVAAAGAGVFGYSTFFMLALQTVAASKGALVITINPAVTLLLAAWIFREPLTRTIGIGMALAVVGAMIVLTRGAPWMIFEGGAGRGELLLLGCVACWVAYTLIGKAVVTGVDALTTTTTTSVLGAIMLVALSLGIEGPATWLSLSGSPIHAWICLAGLAFGATALAYAWYFDGVKALGASTAAGYITLVPVFGVVFSSVGLGEPLDQSLLVGGVLAVAGMIVMHLGRR
ncbi:DMT family transporter [Uliginosibacterium sp. sgz301328]|uniref:DMT family transporter n=1 Tax=Uliginosibacterium sp. sgz301328 TaxID=3243764 RepID=UPI00359F0805